MIPGWTKNMGCVDSDGIVGSMPLTVTTKHITYDEYTVETYASHYHQRSLLS